MLDEIREKLNKVNGELLESFLPFDKKRVLKFQTGLQVLNDAEKNLKSEKKTNLYAVYDDTALEKLLAEHGIHKHDLDKVPDVIERFSEGDIDAYDAIRQLPQLLQDAIKKVNEKNRQLYEIPASGMIAVTLNLIDNDAKDALIAGQAGERTLQAVERIANKSMTDNFSMNKKISSHIFDAPSLEPKYLTAAKAANHLADLLEGAVFLEPKISSDDGIKNSLSALKYMASRIFLQSSKKLKKSGIKDASSGLANLAHHFGRDVNFDSHDEAMHAIKAGLDLAQNIFADKASDEESRYFDEIVKKRLAQLKDLEAV
jgi:hypothetical protein